MFIDFHSHILPGADHGSGSLETSLKQVALAKEAGVDVLIATPHFYPRYESAQDFLQRRKETARQLRESLPPDAPRILTGGEIQLCRGLDRMPELEELCVEGTNVLLLELPRSFSIGHYEQTLDALLYGRKLQVVLAHIDRYDSSVVDLLLDLGFWGQLNFEPFAHWHSRRRVMQWAQNDSIAALGSDIHGTKTGYKDLPKTRKYLGKEFDGIMSRTEALLQL